MRTERSQELAILVAEALSQNMVISSHRRVLRGSCVSIRPIDTNSSDSDSDSDSDSGSDNDNFLLSYSLEEKRGSRELNKRKRLLTTIDNCEISLPVRK